MLVNTPIRQSTARYPTCCSFLVIGYGNALRGDDAVGARVARTVADRNLPKVNAIAVHQLMPELAIEISKVDYVVFVDACAEERCARTIQLDPISANVIRPQSSTHRANSLTHSHSAEGLLALTQKVYGHTPQAWLLQVPTESFEYGEQLSSTAQRGRDEALQTIERFLVNYQVPYRVTSEPCMKSA